MVSVSVPACAVQS